MASTSASRHASGSRARDAPASADGSHRPVSDPDPAQAPGGKIVSKIWKLLGLLGDASLTGQSHGLEVAGTGSVSPQLSPWICLAAGENTDKRFSDNLPV